MNRVVRLTLAVIAGLFLLSCSKEKSVEKNSETPSSVTGSLRMKIDGKQWVADAAAGATIESGIIALYGLGKDKTQFVITLMATTTGTYKLDQQSMSGAAYTDGADANQLAFASNQGAAGNSGGEVIVTKIDETKKTISGTFQIKVFREVDNKGKVLTEGVFEDLSYAPVQPPTGNPGTGNPGTGNPGTGNPGTGSGTFSVKLNNADFKHNLVAGISAFGKITITASETATAKSVGLTFPADIKVGQYALGDMFTDYIGQYNASQSSFFTAESGKLIITEHNTSTKKIVGTFEFKAKELTGTNTANLTAGSFSITYR